RYEDVTVVVVVGGGAVVLLPRDPGHRVRTRGRGPAPHRRVLSGAVRVDVQRRQLLRRRPVLPFGEPLAAALASGVGGEAAGEDLRRGRRGKRRIRLVPRDPR